MDSVVLRDRGAKIKPKSWVLQSGSTCGRDESIKTVERAGQPGSQEQPCNAPCEKSSAAYHSKICFVAFYFLLPWQTTQGLF